MHVRWAMGRRPVCAGRGSAVRLTESDWTFAVSHIGRQDRGVKVHAHFPETYTDHTSNTHVASYHVLNDLDTHRGQET